MIYNNINKYIKIAINNYYNDKINQMMMIILWIIEIYINKYIIKIFMI